MTKAASIHISFQRMLSLQAQQHHNHIYKPITLASGSSGSNARRACKDGRIQSSGSRPSITRYACRARWVYTRKIDGETELSAYKARWVAKGFSQIEGIDFNEHTKTQFGSSHLSTISTLNAIRTISKRLSSMATLRRQSILHHQRQHGPAGYFLGFNIYRDRPARKLHLSQQTLP